MSTVENPEPLNVDVNRAATLNSYTWILASFSLVIFGLRMFVRARLTRNLWWDDWFITISMVCHPVLVRKKSPTNRTKMFTLTFSIMWSVYAGRGYARHAQYLSPEQKSDAGKLSVISRSCCIMAIATGKISVAFLIQRIQGPGKWRVWFLRFISVSVFITALFAVIFLFAQCQPARALWTPSMIKNGTGHCWNPIPVNNYDIVIAGYFAFLDFALAILPVDIVWKLQMATKKKLLLCALLGMGIFAGVCAAIKTSQLRTVTKKTDVTWKTSQYLLWNALEVNIIIVAACIPTLRPLFLVIFRQAGAEAYLKKSYQMTPRTNTGNNRVRAGNSGERTESIKSINREANGKDVPLVEFAEVEGGRHSANSSRDGGKAWSEETRGDEGKKRSKAGIVCTTEVRVMSHDEREREAQHTV
ncbi:MAG: hypothetical protein Q9179_001162 [Wetmoreana sp. 5 TL-2023]